MRKSREELYELDGKALAGVAVVVGNIGNID